MDYRLLVGKRVLLQAKNTGECYDKPAMECTILGLSPSGEWIKGIDSDDNLYWWRISNISIINTFDTMASEGET